MFLRLDLSGICQDKGRLYSDSLAKNSLGKFIIQSMPVTSFDENPGLMTARPGIQSCPISFTLTSIYILIPEQPLINL